MRTLEAPDLILMDITLPEMDGWEVSRLLKADENTRHIPIIALTARVLKAIRPKRLKWAATIMTPSQWTSLD